MWCFDWKYLISRLISVCMGWWGWISAKKWATCTNVLQFEKQLFTLSERFFTAFFFFSKLKIYSTGHLNGKLNISMFLFYIMKIALRSTPCPNESPQNYALHFIPQSLVQLYWDILKLPNGLRVAEIRLLRVAAATCSKIINQGYQCFSFMAQFLH